jgi:multiple sugar transport system permease protein
LPALIFMLAFIGYPIINNIILSFQDVNVMTLSSKVKPFVGLQNYTALLKGKILTTTIINTFVFTVGSIVFQFIIGFALAMFFNMKFSLSKPIRGFLMVAWMIPITVTGLMFKFMFGANGGIINEILLNLHLIGNPVEWLVNPKTAMWAVVIANIWIGIPFNMILITTGLSTVPFDIYESADIDGASHIQKFFLITVPMIIPAIETVLILGFIYTFKVFDLVFVMTSGGPVNATEMLSTYSYRLSFTEFNFSKGAAVANVLFVILFLVSLLYLRLVKEDEVM